MLLGVLLGVLVPFLTATSVLEFPNGSSWEPFHTCTGVDSMPIAWFNRRTNTSFFMSALHENMVAGTAPRLDKPPTNCSGRIFYSHDANGYDSGPSSYANFQWLQSVRVFADGTAAGLVHNEFKGEFAPLGTYCSKQCKDRSPINASNCRDMICELWSTGLAVSSDGGTTFGLVHSPPNHLVAAMPHKFNFDEPINGYGAISPMLQGDDGAFYGLINVKNNCVNGSQACGNISAGNCLFRATDLKDPASFRGRDANGNFTIEWASAYVPGTEDKGECATLPISTESPFGGHVVFRKVVAPSPTPNSTIKYPTYIALGDVSYTGVVKYSWSYEPDFAVAMHNINTSWSPPQLLELDGIGSYYYPTIIDVRSPDLGAKGSLTMQQDGDSYALISYPSLSPEPSPQISSVRVSGAGCSGCNGVYLLATPPHGNPDISHFYRLDGNHSLYKVKNIWHLAHISVAVYYTAASSSDIPPTSGWAIMPGNIGVTPLPAVVDMTEPRGSLYLYLRGGPNHQILRRKVSLRSFEDV